MLRLPASSNRLKTLSRFLRRFGTKLRLYNVEPQPAEAISALLRFIRERRRTSGPFAGWGRLFKGIGIGEQPVFRIIQAQELRTDRHAERRRGRRCREPGLESDRRKPGAIGKRAVALQLIGGSDRSNKNSLERIDDRIQIEICHFLGGRET